MPRRSRTSASSLPPSASGQRWPLWDWRELVAAYLLARAVQDAPLPVPPQERARFSRYVGDVLANPAARSVIVAYTGHNWELFGMWGWMGPFMVASLTSRGSSL